MDVTAQRVGNLLVDVGSQNALLEVVDKHVQRV
jgi:hypothetical protein